MKQISMFEPADVFTVPMRIYPREAEIKRAFERADQDFIERYELFMTRLGRILKDFIAGEITTEYESQHGPISPSQKKALGHLYQRLQKSGVIEKTGEYRARDQGNASAVYRMK